MPARDRTDAVVSRRWCGVASIHASRDLERDGACDCEHCERMCDCAAVTRALDASKGEG